MNVISGFAGAFFAFLFIRLAFFCEKRHERKMINHKAFVRLEQFLQVNLGIISSNKFVIDDHLKTFRRMQKEGRILVNFNRFNFFSISDILLDLLNIDLINDIFYYNNDLRKSNNSLKPINDFFDISRNDLMNNNGIKSYLDNIPFIREQLDVQNIFLVDLDDVTINLLAKVRFLLRDKAPWSSSKYSAQKKKNFKAERERILEEIKRFEKKDKERIGKILNS